MNRVFLLIHRSKAEATLVQRLAAAAAALGPLQPPVVGDVEQLVHCVGERCGPGDLVLVAGGDGTLHALLRSLVDSGATLGVVPLGTANDFARSLGLDPDPLEALGQLAGRGRVERVSLAEINGRLYHSVASLGLGVAITRRLDTRLKRAWGKLAYARAAWSCVRRFRPLRVTATVDGQVHRLRAIQVGVANSDYQGGGMPVAPEPVLPRPELLLYSLPPQPLWRLALMAISAKLRLHHLWHDVTLLRGREIRLETRRPRRIDADGEPSGRTPAHIVVHPAILSVLRPIPEEER